MYSVCFGLFFLEGCPLPAMYTNRSRYPLPPLTNVLYLGLFLFSSAETLLDDFLLTYTVFMTTDDLCQALLRQYPFLSVVLTEIAHLQLGLAVLQAYIKHSKLHAWDN